METVSSDNGWLLLPFIDSGDEQSYPVVLFEEAGGAPSVTTGSKPPQASQPPVERSAGFEKRFIESGLATLEHELIAFTEKQLNHSFRVNTAFAVRGYGAAAELMQRTGFLENCLKHGITPSERALIAAVKIYIAFNRLECARTLLECISERSAQLQYYYALTLHRSGEERAALAACSRVLPGYRPEAAVLYLEAVLLVNTGDLASGLTRLRRAYPYFKENRAFLKYYLKLANLLKSSRDAVKALRVLLRLEPGRADRLEQLAELLYAEENFEEAAELYLHLSEMEGVGQRRALFRYAVCLAYTGGVGRAFEILSGFAGRERGGSLRDVLFALTEQGRDDPLLRPLIARTWIADGDPESCKQYIDSLGPGEDDQRLLLIRAEAVLLQGNFQKALRSLKRLHCKPPLLQAECAFFKGLALFSLKRYQESASYFMTADKGGFRRAACSFYLGDIAYRSGEYEEAVVRLSRSQTGGFKRLQSAVRLACASFKSEKFLVAIEAFKAVLRIDPEFADAYNSLGVIYARQGRSEEAAEVLKQGLKRFPDNRKLHYTLSLVYERVLKQRSRDHFRRYRELEALADDRGGEA